MLTKKIATLAIVGIMLIATTGLTAFAAEAPTNLEEFKANGHTLEGVKNAKTALDEKGLTLEEAKANFEGKVNDFATSKGLTLEEAKDKLADFKESGRSIEGLQDVKADLEEKGITLEEAKDNFATKLSDLADSKGLTLDEAKAKVKEMKENGRTFEGIKNAQEIVGNIPQN